MPFSSKRANDRHASTSSRSPWTTWSDKPVWPSLKVVNSCAWATGIGVLRGIIFSTRPPMVSSPKDSGITSSNSHSLFLLWLPANKSACIAAPKATTWSGSKLFKGCFAKSSATAAWTWGIRVAPPTMTTPFTSWVCRWASRNALRTEVMVLLTKLWVISKNWVWLTSIWTTVPVVRVRCTLAKGARLNCSLVCLAASNNARWSWGARGESFTCSSTQE